jgi:phosphate transport system substrate-binding protein
MALIAASVASAGACARGMETEADARAIGDVPPNTTLAGTITFDGSSTVMPVTTRVTEAFHKDHPGVQTRVAGSGTVAGFKKFCGGQLDLLDASRPINAAENAACEANHVEFVELPFAFDAISIVTSAQNRFLRCLTVDELRHLWAPAAEGTMTRWSQIRAGFPEQPVVLFGPGRESGTFDYFTLAIVGKESSSRSDYTASEDDEVLARGIAANPNALGYFGYSYYREHKDTLTLIAVDSGAGCVAPSMETVAGSRYSLLTRPMFVYANRASLQRPEVGRLAHYYVAPESARFSLEVGYLPLPTVTLAVGCQVSRSGRHGLDVRQPRLGAWRHRGHFCRRRPREERAGTLNPGGPTAAPLRSVFAG